MLYKQYIKDLNNILLIIGLLFISCGKTIDYNKIVEPASLITFGCSLLGAMVAGNISCSKRLKAVDNFNLYVMGIPIR